MRYILAGLLVVVGVVASGRHIIGEKTGDTAIIQVMDRVLSDKGRYEITVETLNFPNAFSTEPLRLKIYGIPYCTTAYVYIFINVGGIDLPVYTSVPVKESALFLIPPPKGRWEVGTYPIKVVISIGDVIDGKPSSNCCLNVEVEQILLVVSPDPTPCPPPTKFSCETRCAWIPCIVPLILLLYCLFCAP